MKPEKVSVLVGKKKTQSITDPKKFSWSWDIHYGVSATLDPNESYKDVLASLTHDLERQINKLFDVETKVKVHLYSIK